MEVNFNDFRTIDILVNQEKDIVIFPLSKSVKPHELANGEIVDGGYFVAFFPIEVKYPYTKELLAEKIKEGIEAWDKYPCFRDQYGDKKTYEAKYYGETSFKKAMKGRRYISLGWNSQLGKSVALFLPLKSGYAYMGMERTKLADDADWMDFAEKVIHYVEIDITALECYKVFKSKLNL